MESSMVNYSAADQASKVAIGMDKLQISGSVGQDISTEVDTRRAGRGLLSTECAGPMKPGIVQLVDHHDGTFTLLIRPQEPGKHLLTVTFNAEQITGSLFTLKISSLPDARKCHVTGPGIQDGVLSMFDSRFRVDTAGAGGGELTVKLTDQKFLPPEFIGRISDEMEANRCFFRPQVGLTKRVLLDALTLCS